LTPPILGFWALVYSPICITDDPPPTAVRYCRVVLPDRGPAGDKKAMSEFRRKQQDKRKQLDKAKAKWHAEQVGSRQAAPEGLQSTAFNVQAVDCFKDMHASCFATIGLVICVAVHDMTFQPVPLPCSEPRALHAGMRARLAARNMAEALAGKHVLHTQQHPLQLLISCRRIHHGKLLRRPVACHTLSMSCVMGFWV